MGVLLLFPIWVCLAYRNLLIINQPILSHPFRRAIEKTRGKEDAIVVGNTMKLTLACDHRTVDGATEYNFYNPLEFISKTPFDFWFPN